MKAFPISASENSHGWSASQGGMDLRDYFAAKAMQGILTDENFHYAAWDNSPDWTENVAMYAYEMADAMMKARDGVENSHEVIAEALTRLKEENNHNACGDPHCGICV